MTFIMLRDIVTDFVLFSGIEGFISCLFFEKIGGVGNLNGMNG